MRLELKNIKKNNKNEERRLSETSRLINYLDRFTRTFQQFSNNKKELREIACLRLQYPFILLPVLKNDLFAGRVRHTAVGFSPQMGSGFGYYVDHEKFAELLNQPQLSQQERQKVDEIYHFWQNENTAYKTRQAYPKHMRDLLPSDNWNGQAGIAFPLYRMAGSTLNYDKLLFLGINGLRQEILQHKNKTQDIDAVKLYDAMDMALDLLVDVCLWYAEQVEEQAANALANARPHAERIAGSLRHIAEHKPETLHHAIQLFWLYALLSGSVDYGRMDMYLVDFIAADMELGRLTRNEALPMLESLWQLINEREDGIWMFDSRIIIGGKGRRNTAMADELALLCIEATRRRRTTMPQLTLRFYEGQNPQLYQKALDCIAENNPYPMLYNDDVNIPAVAHAFSISLEEAVHYCPYGCGEYVIDHKSFGTPSGVINLLQALLVTMNRGADPTTGQKVGISESEISAIDSFDQLYDAYKKQVETHVCLLAEQEELEYRIAAETAPFLYFSMLFDACNERGKAIFDGGAQYLGGTLETYGNTNTADSLLAIKKLVYEQKVFTLPELVAMLRGNFAGNALSRKRLLNVAKYGNDDDLADAMLCQVDRHVFNIAREQKQRTNLHSYLVVVINNNANTMMGRYTGASPDGRLGGTPMNNGNAPSSGMDVNGPTAFLNSIVKPPTNLHAGAVQNMKFSKELFIQQRDKIDILLDTYWNMGGAQAMLNVVGRDELENAIKYPDNYQNLIVRVGGYSAKFVDLDRDIQQEILERTLY